ncbi:MAG: DUF5028 domain-containing protein [Coriobacteriaceae bacterium]|jgi:hypothetical protein|nr:DUF5028 domain-containing protein [Coriobacteriaceae bacterium]
MSRRKLAILAMSVLAAVLIGARIYQVNAEAQPIVAQHYSMGEWVELKGSFLNTSSESTDGYSVKVKSARLVSYNEYIAEFGLDKSKAMEGFDKKSLINIEWEIRNIGNADGGVLVFECKLIPSRKNMYYIPSLSLWQESERFVGEYSFGVSIATDSTYTTNIPYKVNILDPVNYTEFINPISADDTSFELIVCNAPVRKVIDVTLTP